MRVSHDPQLPFINYLLQYAVAGILWNMKLSNGILDIIYIRVLVFGWVPPILAKNQTSFRHQLGMSFDILPFISVQITIFIVVFEDPRLFRVCT